MSHLGVHTSQDTSSGRASSRPRSFIALYVLLGAVLGGLFLRYSWEVSTLALIGPLAFAIFLARPAYGLYVFFAATVLMTEFVPGGATEGIFQFNEPDPSGGIPSLLLLTLLLMFILFAARLSLVERRLPPAPYRPLLCALLIILGAALTGYVKGWSHAGIWNDFKTFFFPLVCVFLCTSILGTSRAINRLLWVIFVAAVVKAAILTSYYLLGRGVLWGEIKVVTYDPADILVFVAMICVTLALATAGDLIGWRRLVLLAAIMPMLFAVVFSFRRAAWLGLLLSLGLMIAWSRSLQRRRLFLIGLCSAVGTIILLAALAAISSDLAFDSELFGQRFASIFSRTSSSNVHHLREPLAVLAEVGRSPVLGLGLGSEHAVVDSGWYEQPLHYVHNEWVFVWMKLGIAGLLGLVWIAVSYVRRVHRFLTQGSMSGLSNSLVLGIGSAAGYWYFQSLLDSMVYFRQRAFLIVGLGVIVWFTTRPQGRRIA